MSALTVLSGSTVATAACPAFALELTWLAVYAQEGGPPLSPAQTRALAQSGVIHGFPVGVLPPSGPAPLTVGVVWVDRPNDPQAIEFDADGDGTPEVVDTRDEFFGHTYTEPGQYPATIRVRDRQGRMTTYKSPVTVLLPEAFDAELQRRWADFRTALNRGDADAAFECVSFLARERQDRAVRVLLRGDVDQTLPPIRSVEFRGIEAVYESLRPAAGHRQPLDVRFEVDLDGVWRVGAFRQKGAPR